MLFQNHYTTILLKWLIKYTFFLIILLFFDSKLDENKILHFTEIIIILQSDFKVNFKKTINSLFEVHFSLFYNL